jgi:hypothetical protein
MFQQQNFIVFHKKDFTHLHHWSEIKHFTEMSNRASPHAQNWFYVLSHALFTPKRQRIDKFASFQVQNLCLL